MKDKLEIENYKIVATINYIQYKLKLVLVKDELAFREILSEYTRIVKVREIKWQHFSKLFLLHVYR